MGGMNIKSGTVSWKIAGTSLSPGSLDSLAMGGRQSLAWTGTGVQQICRDESQSR